MKLVNIIGERAWHVFENGGTQVAEPCTIEEYDSLASPAPVNPTKEGYTWHHSYKDWKYDTESGALEDGCYAVEPSGSVIEKEVGKSQTTRTNDTEEGTVLDEIGGE